MDIPFTKMHGAGNDFVLVDEWEKPLVAEADKPGFVSRVSDRHFGVGSDGVVFIQKSGDFDAKFIFYNPDGSVAEMCGNGIRCFAKYLRQKGYVDSDEFTVETLAGSKEIIFLGEDVRVDMGRPQIDCVGAQVNCGKNSFIDEEILVDGFEFRVTAVGMGNPHAVLFVDELDLFDVVQAGSRIRHYTHAFPNGTNVHFIQPLAENQFRIRTYERGVEAETLACGTGICASAVASVLNHKADPEKPIHFKAKGGDLRVELELTEDEITKVYLIGPAEKVFEGLIDSGL
ncbi:MAG: diaminopimelate epimerase [Candidatus Altiarchaeales archaeon]|nr:diaminopimelate epimerase [Candidatus Altiarchaeales archaeon]